MDPFRDMVSASAFEPFAVDGTLVTRAGASAAVRVIITEAVQRYEMTSAGAGILVSTDQAEFLRSSVDRAHLRHSELQVGSECWRVGEVIEDDGAIITVAIIRRDDEPQ